MTPSVPPATASGFAYSDIRGLQRISSDAEGAHAAAQQFESLFVGMVLKSMRDANAVLAQGNPLSSPEMTLHQEMLDQQWSIHIAEHGGLGLAPIIESQLRGERTPADSEALASGDVPRRPATFRAHGQGFRSADYPSRQAFVGTLLPEFEAALDGTGVDPLHVLAQSALETGWGRHVIHHPDGRSSHNLFGIKADAGWDGDSVEVRTLEVVDGQPEVQAARFRSYPDAAAAVRDYVDFLGSQSRYREVLQSDDGPAFAAALQRAGYATDPAYGHKLRAVLDSLPGMTGS